MHAFGRRFNDDDNIRDGYYLSLYDEDNVVRFCYNVRYVEKNDRVESPTWSIRQTGVHQAYNREQKSSRWILLNPSVYLRQRIDAILGAGPNNKRQQPAAIALHITLLLATCVNWLLYIDDLQSELKVLVCTKIKSAAVLYQLLI